MSAARMPRPPSDSGLISNKAAFEALALQGTLESLGAIADPRLERNVVHPLATILGLVFVAVLCGANNPTEIERFGHLRRKALARHIDLSAGVPTHDTIARVLAVLDPNELERALRGWVDAVRERRVGRQIAVDGKTARGAVPRGATQSRLHVVSAYCVGSNTVLGRLRTEEKSNEITAIPELLDAVNVKKALVSIDAAGCQTAIAAKVIDRGGDYLLALKDNQPKLLADTVELCTGRGCAQRQTSGTEKQERGHGREETRRAWVYEDVEDLHRAHEFKNLAAVIRVESIRRVKDVESREERYYITSQKGLDAATALKQIRAHWAVENQLHWHLDVAFREDEQRLAAGNAVACLSRIRTLALEVLKRAPGPKMPIRAMRQAAAWSDEMLEKLVFGAES